VEIRAEPGHEHGAAKDTQVHQQSRIGVISVIDRVIFQHSESTSDSAQHIVNVGARHVLVGRGELTQIAGVTTPAQVRWGEGMLGGNHDQALLLDDLPGSAVCTCQVGRSVLFSYCEGAIRGIIMLFGIGNIDNPSCCRLQNYQYQEFGKRGQSSGILVLEKLAVPAGEDPGSTSWYVSQGLASGSSTHRGLPSVT
jgi:hypothetical protein